MNAVVQIGLLGLIALGCGCAIPHGYDADMTPTHDGEHWDTFEPQQQGEKL